MSAHMPFNKSPLYGNESQRENWEHKSFGNKNKKQVVNKQLFRFFISVNNRFYSSKLLSDYHLMAEKMSKPRQYHYLRYSLIVVSLISMLITIWMIYSSNTSGIFLPKFSTSVTFMGGSLLFVLLLGIISSMVNSVILLTTFGVLMGILFVMSLVTIVGAIIFLLLTSKMQFQPFLPVLGLTIAFYFLTMISLALKDIIRKMDVSDGGEYNPSEDQPSSPPLILSWKFSVFIMYL